MILFSRQSVQLIGHTNWSSPVQLVSRAARVCTNRLNKSYTFEDSNKLVQGLIKRGHDSPFEFVDFIYEIDTNRAVANELVRHRLCSFLQESQRYVRFDKDELVVVCPKPDPSPRAQELLNASFQNNLDIYNTLINEEGWAPEDARIVIGTGVHTRLIMKTNLRNLKHILKMRFFNKAAWSPIRELGWMLLDCTLQKFPELEEYLGENMPCMPQTLHSKTCENSLLQCELSASCDNNAGEKQEKA